MFKGSLVALITPMRPDGSVDEDAFAAFVDWQIRQGTQGIVPVGTTGESPTLNHDEHRRVVEIAVEVAAGRVPVIAGAGANATAEAIDLVAHAKAAGADAALVVTPYYNRPSQEGMYRHYAAINDAVALPVFVYNVPSRTGVDISNETVARLAKLPNIAGVKDATGRLERVCCQRITCGTDFIQLSGEDATAHGFNAQGGTGCISVTANVAPALCAQMQAACLRGDYAEALRLQDRLMPLHIAIFIEPGLVGAKYAMSRLGLCGETVRLPLVPLTEGTRARIDAALAHAGLL